MATIQELVGARADELIVGVLMCGYRVADAPTLRAPRRRRPLQQLADDEGEPLSPSIYARLIYDA